MERTPPEPMKRVRNEVSPEENSALNPKKRTGSVSTSREPGSVGQTSNEELLQAIGEMMDRKLDNIATREDVKNLHQELTAVRDECDALRAEVRRLSDSNLCLQMKMEAAEKREKKNNLVIRGLPENDQDPSEIVKKLCKERFAIDNVMIKNSFRLGRENADKKRPILVEFVMQDDIRNILTCKGNLKDTGVVVHRDSTLQERKNRSFLWEIKKEIMAINKNASLVLRNGELIVNKKIFSCTNGYKLITKDGEAAEVLGKVLGFDVRQMLAVVTAKMTRKESTHVSNIEEIKNI